MMSGMKATRGVAISALTKTSSVRPRSRLAPMARPSGIPISAARR